MGTKYIYLLLTSRKGITNIKKRATNIKERVTGDAGYISGKHWCRTIKGVTKANVDKHWGGATNVGEQHWLTLWSSGETTKNIDKRKQWQWLGLEQDLNYGAHW